MTNFHELANKTDGLLSPEEIKAALPVAFVLEQAGYVASSSAEDGKLTAPCPFHAGGRGLDIWDDGTRWGCFPCSIPGEDVIDLIGRLNNLSSFSEKVAAASRLAADPALQGWVPPATSARKNLWDQDAAEAAVAAASVSDPTPIAKFLVEKSFANPGLANVDPNFLRDSWLLGANDAGEIVIPYYTRENRLVAYKRRTATTKPDRKSVV